MDKFSMCRICLVEDTAARHCLINTNLQEMYENLTGKPFETKDRRPMQVCYMCHAKLQNSYQLQVNCLQSEELFNQMMLGNKTTSTQLRKRAPFKIVHPLIHFSFLPKMKGENFDKGGKFYNHTQMEIKGNFDNMNKEGYEARDINTEKEQFQLPGPSIVKTEKIDTEDNEWDQNLHQDDYSSLSAPEPVEIDIPNIKVEPSLHSTASQGDMPIESCIKIEYNMEYDTALEESTYDKSSKSFKEQISKSLIDNGQSNAGSSYQEMYHTFPVKYNHTLSGAPGTTKLAVHKPQAVSSNKHIEGNIQQNKYAVGRIKCEEKSTIDVDITDNSNKSGDKLFQCDICDASFIYKSHYKVHIRTHIGMKVHKCNDCDKYFGHKSNLAIHSLIHTGAKPYKCDMCEKCFRGRSQWKIHMRKHTGERPYKCNVCEKSFSNKAILDKHNLTHTGEKPFKCNFCEKCFTQKNSLVDHTRKTHTGEKPYKCDNCDKCFSTRHKLNMHIRLHTGVQPHKCNVCDKCFDNKASLERHIRIHTGEKPYKCDECGKGFSQRAALMNHTHIHSDEKPFRCDNCEKCFYSKGSLVKHNRTHERNK